MLVKIQKWGNSLALRIPSSFASQLNLKLDSLVDLIIDKGQLIIKPVNEAKYDLEELLSKVSEENKHYEVDSGRTQGKELW